MKVTIPVGANWVELRIDLGRGDYQRYQTVLQKVEGEEVSTQITPKMKTGDDTDLVVLAVPAKLLTPGDYVLSLSGMDANGSFEAFPSILQGSPKVKLPARNWCATLLWRTGQPSSRMTGFDPRVLIAFPIPEMSFAFLAVHTSAYPIRSLSL